MAPARSLPHDEWIRSLRFPCSLALLAALGLGCSTTADVAGTAGDAASEAPCASRTPLEAAIHADGLPGLLKTERSRSDTSTVRTLGPNKLRITWSCISCVLPQPQAWPELPRLTRGRPRASLGA